MLKTVSAEPILRYCVSVACSPNTGKTSGLYPSCGPLSLYRRACDWSESADEACSRFDNSLEALLKPHHLGDRAP